MPVRYAKTYCWLGPRALPLPATGWGVGTDAISAAGEAGMAWAERLWGVSVNSVIRRHPALTAIRLGGSQ